MEVTHVENRYRKLHYTEVPSDYKDACFKMYWHACKLLELDPDKKNIPICFITQEKDCSEVFTTSKGRVRGKADAPSNSIFICTDFPLEEALYTVAHELHHIFLLKKFGWCEGFPVRLHDYIEAGADRFAEIACKSFRY